MIKLMVGVFGLVVVGCNSYDGATFGDGSGGADFEMAGSADAVIVGAGGGSLVSAVGVGGGLVASAGSGAIGGSVGVGVGGSSALDGAVAAGSGGVAIGGSSAAGGSSSGAVISVADCRAACVAIANDCTTEQTAAGTTCLDGCATDRTECDAAEAATVHECWVASACDTKTGNLMDVCLADCKSTAASALDCVGAQTACRSDCTTALQTNLATLCTAPSSACLAACT